MEAASPARLYATVVGALLVVLGIVGFFYSASFGSPGSVEATLGVLRVNAWLNVLHIATGALGLLAAGYASRPYALGTRPRSTRSWRSGASRSAPATRSSASSPPAAATTALHLALGLLGLAAAAGTPKARRLAGAGDEAGLEPRAQAAGQGP